MSYEILWAAAAEQDLAAVWLAAEDRDAITRAADALEQQLGRAPLRCGDQQQSSVSRFAVVGPLAVWFEVIEDDKRVIAQGVYVSG